MLARCTSLVQQNKQGHFSRQFHACLPRRNNEFIAQLRSRGLVQDVSSEDEFPDDKPTAVYLGVDPTARSLHAGNLLAFIGLLHFHTRGHQVIGLIGGATGSIGDPSGRSSERNAMDETILAENAAAITTQVQKFFKNGLAYVEKRQAIQGHAVKLPMVVNNLDWTKDITFLDFLRTVGKVSLVGTMLQRESVKNRMASQSGLSFTEFTYQLLQANDFATLYKPPYNCRVQIGGSDQWGNILSGIDLISRNLAWEKDMLYDKKDPRRVEPVKREDKAFGLTIPLLLNAKGEKFGKSTGVAVWLDEKMTSVFDFYQYFLRVEDADVERYLKIFSFLSLEQIQEIMTQHELQKELRYAQRCLAEEVTELVHGDSGLKSAVVATSVIFNRDIADVSGDEILAAFQGDPRLVSLPSKGVLGMPLVRLVGSHTKSVGSASKAKKLLQGGGMYVNGTKVSPDDVDRTLSSEDLIDGKVCIIRAGKTSHTIFEVI